MNVLALIHVMKDLAHSLLPALKSSQKVERHISRFPVHWAGHTDPPKWSPVLPYAYINVPMSS